MVTAGYSGTPLWKKLGFKEGFTARTLNPPSDYPDLLAGLPDGVEFSKNEKAPKDLIHFFTKSAEELKVHLPALKNEIAQNGMVWVSWPKKASKVPTDVTEDVIRNFALQIGMVDVKVCAIDKVWSGLKLVIPVKNRK